MPAPKSLDEALERAPKMSDSGLASQLAQKGLGKLEKISDSAVNEFNALSISSKDDLGKLDIIEVSEQGVSNERSVEIISQMVSSPKGITELALVTQLLLRFAGSSEEKNAQSATQLLAWMKGKDLSFKQKLSKIGSMANQIIPAAERAWRTPTDNWNEVSEMILSGGGMKYLFECFLGTPAETVLEVVAKSLVSSQELRQTAQKIERSKKDVQNATLGLRRTVSHRTKAGRDHLRKFQIAQEKYRKLQSEIDAMKSFDEQGGSVVSPEQMAELDKLAKSCALAFVEYQKWAVLVQTDPAKIEEVRVGLSHGMSLTDSLARNQARLENLSIQFRQNALLRVFQLVLTLSTISSLYCNRVLAVNRKMQMSIIDNCEKTLKLVAHGKFEEALGGSEPSLAPSPVPA